MSDYKLSIRASSGKDFCTGGRGKGEEFGETAMNLIKSIAIKDVFGLTKTVSTSAMEKGIALEGQAIELVNLVYFRNYQKSDTRRFLNGFEGSCDIESESEDLIRDIKCAWTFDSFAWTRDELVKKAVKNGYDIQLRIYMMLYNREFAALDEVLLTTPFDMIPIYEDPFAHEVDHIEESKRVTTVEYTRDRSWEDWLLERHAKAQIIYNQYIEEILNK